MQSTGSHAFCKDLLPRTNGNCLGPGQGFPEPMAIALAPGRASQNQWQLPWPRARPRHSFPDPVTLIPIEYSMICHTQHSQYVPCVPTVDEHPFSSSANFPRAPQIPPGRKTRVFGPKDQGLWATQTKVFGAKDQVLLTQRPRSLGAGEANH